MAVSAVYVPYAVNINRAVDLLIDGVVNQVVDTGLAEYVLLADGGVDPTMIGVGEHRPMIGFGTTSLGTLLAEASDAFLTAGLALSGSAIAEAYCYKVAEAGTRAGAGSHVKVAVNQGLLVPRGFSVAVGRTPALLDCDIVATYDGTNAPFVITDSADVPGTPHADESYFMGPLTINGSAIDGVQAVRYQTGITLLTLSGAAGYAEFVAIASRLPLLTATVVDVGALYDLGLSGTKQSDTDSAFYLRQGATDTPRTADASEAHIKLTFDEGLAWVRRLSGDHPYMAQLVYQPIWDGSNAAVVVDTDSAIP